MCFHSKQTQSATTLESRFKVKSKPNIVVDSAHFNAFEFPKTPVVIDIENDTLQSLNWGLIPSWAESKDIRKYTLNAKIETLEQKPSFRNSITKRCWVIADGFMEWQRLDAKGKKKQGYIIGLKSGEPFAMAGIWSEWIDKDSGELLRTYSIVTTEANPFMAKIHNSKKRMPIILTPENELNWLNGQDLQSFRICELELDALPFGPSIQSNTLF